MKRFLRLHAFFFALTRPNKIKACIPLGQALCNLYTILPLD
jgi:hypothetical protein